MQGSGWVQRRTSSTLGKSLRLALKSISNGGLVRELIRPALESWQRGDLENAEMQLRRATLSDDHDVRALAQLLLADTLRSREKIGDAFAALNQAAQSANEVIGSLAACVLGNMYEEYGDIQAARLAYQSAIGSPAPDISARARAHMAELMYFEGESNGAIELLREVLHSGVEEWSGRAAGLLGDILFAIGELDGAYGAFSEAAKLDASDEADRAVVMLSVIIDARHGGLDAVEDFAALDSEGAPSERSAYIKYALMRWRPGGVARMSTAPVNPAWESYYQSALNYYTDAQGADSSDK